MAAGYNYWPQTPWKLSYTLNFYMGYRKADGDWDLNLLWPIPNDPAPAAGPARVYHVARLDESPLLGDGAESPQMTAGSWAVPDYYGWPDFFRHQRNTAVNLLMLDGHVEAVKKGQLLIPPYMNEGLEPR